MDLKQFIRDVPDFPKKGIIFKDITTLLKEKDAFRHVIRVLADRHRGKKIDKIVGIESRGFIFAAALAYELGVGMVPVRKAGKLPWKTASVTYDLEYGTDTVEIHEDAVSAGEQVLVVDDLLATGGTMAATCGLVEKLGATVIEVDAVIELTFLPGREKIARFPFHTLIQY
jgi:adenine phosphoribosyltransferase